MMHGRGSRTGHRSWNPANKAERSAAESVEPGRDQGECAPSKHAPDTVPGSACDARSPHAYHDLFDDTFGPRYGRVRKSLIYGSVQGHKVTASLPRQTARVHHAARRRGGLAARGARATAEDAGDRLSRQQIVGWHDKPSCFIPPRPQRGRICRGRERHDHLPLGGRPSRSSA